MTLCCKYCVPLNAVEPPALVDIFSVDSESGLVVVDATGPHLLAAGTLGYINVCGAFIMQSILHVDFNLTCNLLLLYIYMYIYISVTTFGLVSIVLTSVKD